MSELAPEPVDTPEGKSYIVRVYRTGSMARFPSAESAPRNPGGLLLAPLMLLGWLAHVVAFRGRWTVAVTPWHNLPGHRYRERVASRSEADSRAAVLAAAIRAGKWKPGAGDPIQQQVAGR